MNKLLFLFRTLVVLIYLCTSILSFGILNGSSRADFHALLSDHRFVKNSCGVAAAFSLFGPISLLTAYTLSGFAEDGMSFSCKEVV